MVRYLLMILKIFSNLEESRLLGFHEAGDPKETINVSTGREITVSYLFLWDFLCITVVMFCQAAGISPSCRKDVLPWMFS